MLQMASSEKGAFDQNDKGMVRGTVTDSQSMYGDANSAAWTYCGVI